MAYHLALMVKHTFPNEEIEFIVSPYEADAQLAYLSRTNYVDYIVTEDSDLIAFGAKRILYKLNTDGGC